MVHTQILQVAIFLSMLKHIVLRDVAMTIKDILLTPPISGSNFNFLIDSNRTTCIQSNSTTIAVWEILIEKISPIKMIKVDLLTDSPLNVDILVIGKNKTSLCGRAESYLGSGSSLIVVCPSGLEGNSIRMTQRSYPEMIFKLCEISVFSSYGVAACLKADTPLNARGQKQVGTESTMYVFTCNQGYELMGEKSVHCQSNGSWSSTSAVCIKKNICESLPHVANGIVYRTSINSSALLVCNEGFKPLTDDKIYCLPTGKWSSNSLHCIPIECKRNPIIPFGRGHLIDGNSVYGSRLQIKCDLGYAAIESDLRQCQQDASWGNLDICLELNCGKPLNENCGQWIPLNISFIFVLICDSGCHIEGSPPVIQCLPNGTWTHTFAVCRNMNRSDLKMWTLNSMLLTTVGVGTTILFLVLCVLLLKKRLYLKSTVFQSNDAMELSSMDPVYAQPFENKKTEDFYSTHIYAEPIDSSLPNQKKMFRDQMIDNQIYHF
ncbi:E-selectin isoform X2 [Parasteatoda tepidariorum]|uniref:E-selectin isoform X2 n=1 Tax=Parasteatoda tepidariorum TaxID=114398 RepID=UPI001C71A867|nr:sushi, von Willebrand factor type A, EGF and pentraxin domain-containing protein 1 isoform X2 [Parasteatoda tepidariorum]